MSGARTGGGLGYAVTPVNTPGHAILNLALLCRGPRRDLAPAVLVGAVLPDLPILIFYLVARIGLGHSETQIWTHDYFLSDWQTVFDLAHSIPVALLGLGIARLLTRPAAQAFFTSLLLHSVGDLPLHHDDAHRHFLPLSDLRIMSPVSYWDPDHHGSLAALIELGLVCIASLWLWKRFRSRAARATLLAVVGLYVSAYAFFQLAAPLAG